MTSTTTRPATDGITGTQRRAALGALSVLALAGALGNARSYGAVMSHTSTALLTCLPIVALICLVVWLLIRRLGRGLARPAWWGLSALAVGATTPTWTSSYANEQWGTVTTRLLPAEVSAHWGSFVAGPLSEEIAKAACAALILITAGAAARRPLAGFFVGATVGLGFQLFEDITFASWAALDHPDSDLAGALPTAILRAVTGLWSHWVFSGIAGVGVALLLGTATHLARRREIRIGLGLVGLAIAVHALTNVPTPSGPAALVLLVATPLVALLSLRRVLRWARGTETASESSPA